MATPNPIPVILDTDLGTDIDDTWALAQLLRCPELDLKLVLTATGDATYRAKVNAKFLGIAGRSDIPVGLGVNSHEMTGGKYQEPWVKGYELAHYNGEIVEDGVGRLIKIIEDSLVPVTIIAIAPSGNLAAAVTRAPLIAAKCKLVGMFGSFDVGYTGGLPASNETNVRENPSALRTVLSAPWLDVLLTPLDTCNAAVLRGNNYHSIWTATGDVTLRALIENYCIFAPLVGWMHCDYFTTRSTVLFDCVAVYLAYAENWVETETVRFRITDDGYTIRDEAGPFSARVALRWNDLNAFHDDLTNRLHGGAL